MNSRIMSVAALLTAAALTASADFQASFNAGRQAFRQKQFDAALTGYQQAAEAAANPGQRCQAFRGMADSYMAKKDWKNAEETLAKILKDESIPATNRMSAQIGLGDCRQLQRKPAEALAEIRAELAGTRELSPRDFELGDKLLSEMKKAGMKKPLLYGKRYFFTEPVLWCTSKMFLTEKNWLDQPLFKSREYYEIGPSQYKMPGVAKNLELLRETGLDGFGMFVNLDITRDTVNMIGRYSTKDYPLFCMPTLCPEGAYGPLKNQHLDFLAKHPAVLRWQGKPVYATYGCDTKTPREIADYIAEIRKLSGSDCCYIHTVGSLRVCTDPYHYYMENNGRVPASVILKWYDKITEYLEVSGGVKFANRLTYRDIRYNAEYYDKVILPLFSAAVAQEKFCGKKLFGFNIMTGYDAFLGNQTLCHDGTKTFRKAYEQALKYPIDIILQFEWDETNEDTSIQPMICRPMAYQRIIRYYTDTMKKIPLKPRAGDDLTLPNLIVSQLRQYVPGSPFEVELLNVPDSPEKEDYTVDLEMTGHNGRVFWKAGNLKFNSAKLQEHNLCIPADVMARQRCAVPRLTIRYKGKTRVIGEGMPFTAIRATTKNDHLYLCTPIRNLMFPEKPDVSIKTIVNDGMVSKYDIAADLNFPGHKLQALDVVENSYDIFSYDPKDEYLQSAQEERRHYRFSWQYLNSDKGGPASIWIDQKFELKGTDSGVFFAPAKEPRRNYLINYGALFRQIPWDAAITDPKAHAGLGHSTYVFSVEKKEAEKAVFTVSGKRLSGPYQGKTFTWSVPLKALWKYGIRTKVLADGLQFGLETLYRPERQPMPLMTEHVRFKSAIHSDIPEGILAFRAISRDGRVWWSKPYAVTGDTGKMQEIQAYDRDKGFHTLNVEANRVPRIVYCFDPERSGDTLTTDAGREFYASLGASNTISTGFQGQSHSYGSAPRIINRDMNGDGRNNTAAPAWEKLSDGKYALRFTGKPNAFLNFPPGTFPHKNGFTAEFDVFPEEVGRDQIYFGMYSGTALTGFRLRTEKGKFAVDFQNRRPHDKTSPLSPLDTRVSKLGPVPGRWNHIRFRYDGRAVYLAIDNGPEDVLPFSGITRYTNGVIFAGDGSKAPDGNPRFFKGLLCSFSIKHTAKP